MEQNGNRTEDKRYEMISGVLDIIESSGRKYDIEKIKSAYEYAALMHEGQFRVSGDPYISHPVAVAEIVASLGLDTDSICAAFLHDTLEDCSDKTNIGILEEKFGQEVAMLVDGLTKIKDINVIDKEETHIENIRKMLLAMSKDIRVIFIKLCDRLHNMRTLNAKPENKRRMTALETMHVYAPLAHRLGMQRMKQELENLALQFLDPIGYSEVSEDIQKKYGRNVNFIENTKKIVSDKLAEYDMKYTLEGRVKTVYSIYRKMFNQNKSFDEIYDFYALRIIVNTELECYTVLGIIHEMFNSVPGRFKDYISTPKPNMYQSLHTTVIGKDGIPFEVQIRTYEMHHVAEYGVAAHWKYKSGESSKEEIDRKLSWIARLIDAEEGIVDMDDFLHALKIDIFHDETFVFTPKGDVIALPQGSTVIDFAYAIHSEVGNKMTGATINGMIAPFERVPQTGDIVEIITSKSSKGPSRDWLKIVRTGEARNKIRQWFKKEKRTENIAVGKGEVEHEFMKLNSRLTDKQKKEIMEAVTKKSGMHDANDLYNAIGYGGMPMSKLSPKIKDEYEKFAKTEEEQSDVTIMPTVQKKHKVSSGGIIVDGLEGCAVKFAKCCSPLPGDPIIGFITLGYGITVHKASCVNIRKKLGDKEYLDRIINVDWDKDFIKNASNSFQTVICVESRNDFKVLGDISTILADMKVPLISINSSRDGEDDMTTTLTIGCRNNEQCKAILSKFQSVQSVYTAYRKNV